MGENDAKTLQVDKIFFGKRRKKLRLQTSTDTCGQGLRENEENWSLEQDEKTKSITIQSLLTKIDLWKDCAENQLRATQHIIIC